MAFALDVLISRISLVPDKIITMQLTIMSLVYASMSEQGYFGLSHLVKSITSHETICPI